MISTIISKLQAGNDAPLSSVSAAGTSPIAGGSDAGTVNNQPCEFPHNSLSSTVDSDDDDRRATGSEPSSVKEEAEKKGPCSKRETVEDVANMSASSSERGPTEDIAKLGDTETPVAYENASTYLLTKCDDSPRMC